MKTRNVASTLAAIAALILVACGGDGAAEPQDAPDAPLSESPAAPANPIELSVAVAESKVKLGDDITFKVTLKNASSETQKVNVPRLARRSLSFRVREGTTVRQLERLRFDINPANNEIVWQSNAVKDLAAGEELTAEVKTVAIKPGTFSFTPQYLRQGARPIQGEPATVEVTPDGAKGQLGVRMETSKGAMVFKLRPDLAYTTVESFASLAKSGFHDGLTFHRIIAGFMAQGGDPLGTGSGGPGYFIPGEMQQKLLHDRGVLSMARTSHPQVGKHTAGSQFFILFARRPDLDPGFRRGDGYTTFGEMLEGDDTLKALEAVEVKMNASREVSEPIEPVKMTKMTLITL